MISVSVAIITKNEERNLRDALESVKDFEDIIIVDSFSEDKTVDISREYTKRIFQHQWQGYAKQKQIAVDYALKDWVLILDADERVPPELKKEIVNKLSSNVDVNGFYIPRKNFFLGKWIRHSGWWPDYTLRLFRKNASFVEMREVHEKVIVKDGVGYLKSHLEHYTYRTISDYIRKMKTYAALSAKELLARTPKRSSIKLISNMVFSPTFTFLKMFFLKQGFRDGLHGFILAVFYSFYAFLKYTNVWYEQTALQCSNIPDNNIKKHGSYH